MPPSSSSRSNEISARFCKPTPRKIRMQNSIKGLTVLTATLYSSSCECHIPQHRVRASRRALDYGSDHPWNNFTSINLGTNAVVNDHYENDETVPASGLTNHGLSSSGGAAHTNARQPGELVVDLAEDTDENDLNQEMSSASSSQTDFHRDSLNQQRRGQDVTNYANLTSRPASSSFTPSASPTVYSSFATNNPSPSLTSEYPSGIPSTLIQNQTNQTDLSNRTNTNIFYGNETTPPQPIRIRPFLYDHSSTGTSFLSQYEQDYLLNKVLQPAIDIWSDALHIRQVQGSLTMDKGQLYDGESCGPGIDSGFPSVVVPHSHFSEGLEETDLIVYVSVSFLEERVNKPASKTPIRNDSNKHQKGNTEPTSDHPSVSPPPTSSSQPSNSTTSAPSTSPSLSTSPSTSTAPSASPTHSTSPTSSPLPTTSTAPTFVTSDAPSLANTTTPSISSNPTTMPSTSNPPSISSPPTDSSHPSTSPSISTSPSTSTPPTTSTPPSEKPTMGPSFTPSTSPPSSNPSTVPSSLPTMATPYCDGEYLASATYCNTDQFDRPVAGMINFCINRHDFFSTKKLELNKVTAMHELGHVLGFNTHSLAHFRNRKNGKPLTDRDEDNDVPLVKVQCTGVRKNLGYATIPLPSEKILQFTESRGVRVAQIVTPTVKQVTRNQFDCQSLGGAELESEFYHQVNQTNMCINDHWDRRLFKMDVMNPIVDNIKFKSHISPLTLAYFIDSGWYHVDVSRMSLPDSWGRGAGCDFVEKSCITSKGEVSLTNSQFFCGLSLSHNNHKKIEYGCTDDLTRKAQCSITEYDSDLPPEYRYFSSKGYHRFGGYDPYLDYCPLYQGIDDGLCMDSKSTIIDLERSGSNSRCIAGRINGEKQPLCLKIACVVEGRVFRVQVDGIWKTCSYDGQQLSIISQGDYVICPDARRICPTFFCPGNCMGEDFVGVCNSTSGNCMCPDTDGPDGSSGLCNEEHNLTSHNVLLEPSVAAYYYLNGNELRNEKKDIFEQTARMFNHMSLGDVIGFVACSLVGVLLFIVVLLFLCRMKKNGNLKFQKLSECFHYFWSKTEWTVNAMHMNPRGRNNNDRNRNKEKMVASILVDMRVQANDEGDTGKEEMVKVLETCNKQPQVNVGLSHDTERTFLRSELPPLPNFGRILLIPGSNYIDDSPLESEHFPSSSATEGTVVTISVERSSNLDSNLDACSLANTRDSITDSRSEVNNFDDDPYIIGIDRPRRRRFVDRILGRTR